MVLSQSKDFNYLTVFSNKRYITPGCEMPIQSNLTPSNISVGDIETNAAYHREHRTVTEMLVTSLIINGAKSLYMMSYKQ